MLGRATPFYSRSGPRGSQSEIWRMILLDELERVLRAGGTRADRARHAAAAIRRAGGFHWVGLYDVTATDIAAIAWTGTEAPAFPRFPRNRGLNGAAVAAEETVVANDVARDSRYLTTFGATGAEMVVPVRDAAGAVVGTIDVESPHVGAFGPKEQTLVERCAPALLPLWSGR
jgi:putative methionine-R-sulfoxide reductase with GAF domain